jgi:hypothetical protein
MRFLGSSFACALSRRLDSGLVLLRLERLILAAASMTP